MTREEILDLYRRHLSAEQDTHDADAAAAGYAEDGYYELVPFGVRLQGRPAVAANYLSTMLAMPDVRFDIDGEIVDGGHLVHWGRMLGTVTGPYLGHEPTGREVRLPFLARFEFGDGEILGEQLWFDAATLFEQAGLDRDVVLRHLRALAADDRVATVGGGR